MTATTTTLIRRVIRDRPGTLLDPYGGGYDLHDDPWADPADPTLFVDLDGNGYVANMIPEVAGSWSVVVSTWPGSNWPLKLLHNGPDADLAAFYWHERVAVGSIDVDGTIRDWHWRPGYPQRLTQP